MKWLHHQGCRMPKFEHTSIATIETEARKKWGELGVLGNKSKLDYKLHGNEQELFGNNGICRKSTVDICRKSSQRMRNWLKSLIKHVCQHQGHTAGQIKVRPHSSSIFRKRLNSFIAFIISKINTHLLVHPLVYYSDFNFPKQIMLAYNVLSEELFSQLKLKQRLDHGYNFHEFWSYMELIIESVQREESTITEIIMMINIWKDFLLNLISSIAENAKQFQLRSLPRIKSLLLIFQSICNRPQNCSNDIDNDGSLDNLVSSYHSSNVEVLRRQPIDIQLLKQCLIDELTLEVDHILLSRESSEFCLIKDKPEDLTSLEKSMPPLFEHGYTKEKLESGSDTLTGTTLSAECSIDISNTDLESLTDSSLSSFGSDAESILPEVADPIVHDIRVKDKGNQFITDDKTNTSHENQLKVYYSDFYSPKKIMLAYNVLLEELLGQLKLKQRLNHGYNFHEFWSYIELIIESVQREESTITEIIMMINIWKDFSNNLISSIAEDAEQFQHRSLLKNSKLLERHLIFRTIPDRLQNFNCSNDIDNEGSLDNLVSSYHGRSWEVHRIIQLGYESMQAHIHIDNNADIIDSAGIQFLFGQEQTKLKPCWMHLIGILCTDISGVFSDNQADLCLNQWQKNLIYVPKFYLTINILHLLPTIKPHNNNFTEVWFTGLETIYGNCSLNGIRLFTDCMYVQEIDLGWTNLNIVLKSSQFNIVTLFSEIGQNICGLKAKENSVDRVAGCNEFHYCIDDVNYIDWLENTSFLYVCLFYQYEILRFIGASMIKSLLNELCTDVGFKDQSANINVAFTLNEQSRKETNRDAPISNICTMHYVQILIVFNSLDCAKEQKAPKRSELKCEYKVCLSSKYVDEYPQLIVCRHGDTKVESKLNKEKKESDNQFDDTFSACRCTNSLNLVFKLYDNTLAEGFGCEAIAVEKLDVAQETFLTIAAMLREENALVLERQMKFEGIDALQLMIELSEQDTHFIKMIRKRSGKDKNNLKPQVFHVINSPTDVNSETIKADTDFIDMNTNRSRHNSSSDDTDNISAFGQTCQIQDSVGVSGVDHHSPIVTSGSTLDHERCYCTNFQTCKFTHDKGTEVSSGNSYEEEKENVADFLHSRKNVAGSDKETETIDEVGNQYQEGYHDLLSTIENFKLQPLEELQSLKECLIDESLTLEVDHILLSRESSELCLIKDKPEDLISLERSMPPLFEHGYTEEKLESGSDILTGTTLSSECSIDMNITDLDSLTDSSLSSFGSDAESILPEVADLIFQDIRVKDKGNIFITDDKTNTSHENQLINGNICLNYARKILLDVASRNVSQLRNVKFGNSYVEESPFQGHSLDFCKNGLNAFTIISVLKFPSTKDKWLEAPFTMKKFDLDQKFYKALPSQKIDFSTDIEENACYYIDFSTDIEENACYYIACSPFCNIHPSIYDFEMSKIEQISDMNYLTVICSIWNRYIAQDCIMMKTIEKQLQRAKARRRCIIFERLSIDESEKHTIDTSRNYSHGFDASFIQRSEGYCFENELKYCCSSKIRLGHTEKSVLLNLDDFMAYMDTCSKEHNNSKETSQTLKQLLRKLNVKNIIASQNATVGCSRKKRIRRHVRRHTLEQLMKQFFKNMETDFPNKSMTPSSKNLFKKIFEYLPFRYEQKIFVFPINGLQQYFEQMSVPVASRPPHAETMKFEWVRVRSYWSFPSNIRVSPIAMARVGFYYTGKCAECRCFSCGAIHREWRDGDDPYVIHQQISPNCFYLNGQESGNVPIHEEDRLKPRHHVDQALVTNTASANPSGIAAAAEAIQLPGLSSEEISRIQVPPQRGALGTSQSGDFSFRPQSSQASSATTTQQTAVSQAPSSYFSRPPQASENAVAQSLSLFSATSSSQANTNAPSLSQNSSNLTSRAPSQSQTSTAPASIPKTTANIQDPSSVVTTTASVSTTNPGGSTSTTTSSTSQAPPTSLTSQPPPTSSTSQPPPTSSTSQPPLTATAASTSSSTGASSNTTVGSEPSRSRFDPLGINFEKPRYPAYAVLTLRVNTYNGWPSYLDQTPRTMAKAGFFYAGYGDYTRCFFCGGGLRNWEAGDDPWVEHARWFPKCAFLRQNRGDSFVNMVQTRHQEAESTNQPIILPRQLSVLDQGRPVNLMSSIPVQTLREMGKDDTIINEAIDRWRATRQEEGLSHENSEIHAIEIYEVILQIEEERAARTSSQLPGQQLSLIQYESSPPTSQLATAQTTEVSTGAEGTDEPEYLRGFDKVLEEYEEQKERLTCKICLENPVAVAFLPCGHLVCCLDCAPAMRKCPVCDELVKGTIKTFFP